MAYPFPAFQQPFQYQDQLNQLRTAPMQQPYPMPQFGRQDPSGINWVQGEAGAKSWFVAPGASVLLMDSEAQRFYLKTADVNGIPGMRTFEYNEVGIKKPQEENKTDNFVPFDVFNEFRSQVLSKLEDLSEPVEVSVSRKGKKGDAND